MAASQDSPALVANDRSIRLDSRRRFSASNASNSGMLNCSSSGTDLPRWRVVPRRAAGCQPVTWIEHYSAQCGLREEYDLVIFVPWRITVARVGGVRRRSLGTPSWRRLTAAEVDELLGVERVAC